MENRLQKLLHEGVITPEMDEKIRSTLALVPLAESVDEDIFLVSFPKSGNTWLRNLAAGVVHGLDPEFAPFELIADVIPGHKNIYYKRYQTPTFFKSHHLPQPQNKRVVYVLRDGRDVMVSYFHHICAVRGKEIDFLKLAQGKVHFSPYCQWHEHVNTWLANPYQAQMLIVRYEDLKKNPVHELKRFCGFAGVEREEAFLAAMVEKASFEKMRQKETRLGRGNPNWPKDKFFVRRGQVGSHKDEMPPEVLEAFLNEAGDTLRKLGYL